MRCSTRARWVGVFASCWTCRLHPGNRGAWALPRCGWWRGRSAAPLVKWGADLHDIVVSEFSSPVGLPDTRVRRWGKQNINSPALHNLLPLRVEVQLSLDPHGYEGQWVHGVVTSLTLRHLVKTCCCQVGLEAQHATDKTLP